jgi:hypothetical protein
MSEGCIQRIRETQVLGFRYVILWAHRGLCATFLYFHVRPAIRIFLDIFNKGRRNFGVLTALTVNPFRCNATYVAIFSRKCRKNILCLLYSSLFTLQMETLPAYEMWTIHNQNT